MKSGKFIPIELLNNDFYGISAIVTAAGESPLGEHEYDLFDIISRDSHAAILIKNYILNDLNERIKVERRWLYDRFKKFKISCFGKWCHW